MTALSVNLNKVALLRNSRALGIPSVTRAATIALNAGARGITVHPRPDGRHIRADDVHALAALLKQHPRAEFNIEGNPFHNLMDFVRDLRPHQCTFVPDSEGHRTVRSESVVDGTIRTMNAILTPQANVQFALNGVRNVTVPEDLGCLIGGESEAVCRDEWGKIVRYRDPLSD